MKTSIDMDLLVVPGNRVGLARNGNILLPEYTAMPMAAALILNEEIKVPIVLGGGHWFETHWPILVNEPPLVELDLSAETIRKAKLHPPVSALLFLWMAEEEIDPSILMTEQDSLTQGESAVLIAHLVKQLGSKRVGVLGTLYDFYKSRPDIGNALLFRNAFAEAELPFPYLIFAEQVLFEHDESWGEAIIRFYGECGGLFHDHGDMIVDWLVDGQNLSEFPLPIELDS